MDIHRYDRYGLSGIVGIVLLGLGLAGAPGCRRSSTTHASAENEIKPPPTAPPAVATAATGLRSGSTAILNRVEPQELPTIPTRFDPSGRFMAVMDEKKGCLLWSVAEQAYVGTVAADKCSDWPLVACVFMSGDYEKAKPDPSDKVSCRFAPAGERTRRAPDGEQTAHWNGDKLWITRKGSPDLTLTTGCAKDGCPAVIGVAFSPDSKLLALGRERTNRIYIIDTQTGKSPKTIKLEQNEFVLPELLAWGQGGVTAVIAEKVTPAADKAAAPDAAKPDAAKPDAAKPDAAKPDAAKSDTEEEATADFTSAALVHWRGASYSRKAGPWKSPFGNDEGMGAITLGLDPLGRYLFESYEVRREGDVMKITALDEKRESPLSWKHDDGRTCSESELAPGKWRSGTWPVWETIETTGADCDPSYSAWQIYTAPGKRGYDVVDLKQKPADSAVRVVKEDGTTVTTLHGKAAKGVQAVTGNLDPGKRWEGTGKNSLRRISDKEELILTDKSCAHTAAGAFDCTLQSFADQTFLLGSDPLSAPVIHGEQVAHLFYHPNLIEDFFSDKPVAVSAKVKAPVGLAPRLDKTALRYLDGPTANLEVTLLAHDGGDGVAALRVWADGRPLPTDPAITLTAETPTPVTLSIPPATCGHVRIMVCNTPGLVCSRAVDVPFCAKKKHHIK